jgi:DNA polymerase III delta prime subunit
MNNVGMNNVGMNNVGMNNVGMNNVGMNNKQHFLCVTNAEYNSAYSNWQNEHEAFIKPIEDVIKEKKYINTSITKIDDIIKIIESNPYDNRYEYNIDLKMLHNIYDELKQINNMIGLETLKMSIVDQLLYFIQKLHVDINSQVDINNEGDYKHTVLSGPPGTGKTEIAKLLGLLYSKIGILKNNTFQKVTRSDLIAGYLGQTAIKTKKVIEKSIGGVLFIDEAYSLADYSQNDSFSKECIDTICEALSEHKGDLMVIIAGYEDELNETFFKVNKGLESRFIWRFKMDSYSSVELKHIFIKKINDNGWCLESKTKESLETVDVKIDIPNSWFEKRIKTFKHYGRDMDSLFTYTKVSHGRRIYGKPAEYRKKISMDDLDKGYELFIKNKQIKEKDNFIQYMYV